MITKDHKESKISVKIATFNPMKKALVSGATGLIGTALVNQLIASNEYDEIICLVRKTIEVTSPKITQIVVDYSDLSEQLQNRSADSAFCCLGTTLKVAGSKERQYEIDHDYVVHFAAMCHSIGIPTFMVISSIGASVSTRNFYLRTKGEMERDCLAIDFKKIVILRPSFLLGDRKEFRLGEKIGVVFMKGLSFLLIGSLRKYKGIHVDRIAKRMIELSLENSVEKTVILESNEI